MKRAYCVNLGCGENRLDGVLIERYLQTNQWILTSRPEEADLIVVNSCGFTEETERHSLEVYGDLVSTARPDARVIFAGCLPAINKKAIRDAGYSDVCVTPRTLHLLDGVTEALVSIDQTPHSGCIPSTSDNIDSFASARSKKIIDIAKGVVAALERIPCFPIPRWLWQMRYFPSKGIEYVRISVGCRNHCTFCAIPRAKGSTRSVPMGTVLEQIQDALRRGKKYIALSCDELASYGQDMGTNIATLLDEITKEPESFKLILRNAHPEWIIRYWEGLEPVFRRGKIGFITLPLQSGSDRILGMMERNYTASQYRWLVDRMRAAAPRLIIRTHILTGFPGETEADFEETCRFVKELPVDMNFSHCYSERNATPSARLPEKVPEQIAIQRRRRLKWIALVNFFRPARWFPLRP